MIDKRKVLVLILLVSVSLILTFPRVISLRRGRMVIDGGGGGLPSTRPTSGSQTTTNPHPNQGPVPTCYPAGTEIRMADGSLKDIEDVEVGEKVLSFDPEKGEYVETEVTQLHSPVREGVYNINNGLIKPTRDHPIYVKKEDGRKRWAAIDPEMGERVYDLSTELMKLEVGDKIYKRGEWVEVESMEYEEGPIQTYTFNVDAKDPDRNNYFANGILSHNLCKGLPPRSEEIKPSTGPTKEPRLSDDENFVIVDGEKIAITSEMLQQGYVETKDGDKVKIKNLEKTDTKIVDGEKYNIYETQSGEKIACKGRNCPGDRPRDLEDRPSKPSTSSTTTTCDPNCQPWSSICDESVPDGCGGTCTRDTDGKNCGDGEWCTVNDECSGGSCGGSSRNCDDGNSCTLDSCDEANDDCTNNLKCDGSTCSVGSSDYNQYCSDSAVSISVFEINNDHRYTNSTDVTLKTKARNVNECKYKNEGGPWSPWYTSYSPKDWDLTSGDGKKTVQVKCRGDEGSVTDSDSIQLDTHPPLVNVTHHPRAVKETDEITVSTSSSDPGSGIEKTELHMDEDVDEEKTCYSPTCEKVIGSYSCGTNITYYSEAVDNAGNVGKAKTKSLTVCCSGPGCVSLSIPKDKFYLKPNDVRVLTVKLTSTSVNDEIIELFVENWDGEYEFKRSTCSNCKCSKCGHSGKKIGKRHDKNDNITLEVPKTGSAQVNLSFRVEDRKRPGKYVMKIKSVGA